MRSRTGKLVSLTAMLMAIVTALGVQPETARAQEASPEEVVAAYNAALNAGDLDALMALIDPEIVDVSWACDLRFGRDCVGAEEYRALVAGAIDQQEIQETTLGTKVEGDQVTVYIELRFKDLETLPEVERLRETVLFEVQHGLITREVVTLDLEDAQTATFAEVLAQLAAGPPPAPGTAGNLGPVGDAAGARGLEWLLLAGVAIGLGATRVAVGRGARRRGAG